MGSKNCQGHLAQNPADTDLPGTCPGSVKQELHEGSPVVPKPLLDT